MTDIIDDPTPTQKIWGDVSSLQQKHTDALMRLYNAVLEESRTATLEAWRKAHAKAVKAHREIMDIEDLQKEVHAAARRHAVKKAYSKVVNQRANAAR
jgi:aspartokinase